MQQIYHAIFHIALKELPHKLRKQSDEEAIFHKGFKISRRKDVYYWQDIRNSNLYGDVDPLITEKVLTHGFCHTLRLVLNHDDIRKIKKIDRIVVQINKEIENYVVLATEAYTKTQSDLKLLRKSSLSKSAIKSKVVILNRRLQAKKKLFAKKRNILKEKKAELLAERIFIKSRLIN